MVFAFFLSKFKTLVLLKMMCYYEKFKTTYVLLRSVSKNHITSRSATVMKCRALSSRHQAQQKKSGSLIYCNNS